MNRFVTRALSTMVVFLTLSLGILSSPVLGNSQDENSLVSLGNTVTVEKEQVVEGAVAIGGDVNVYGTVREDVVSIGGSVFLGPEATVHGDIISIGGSVIRQEGSRVGGKITVFDTSDVSGLFSFFTKEHMPSMPEIPRGFSIISFLGYLALALLVVLIIPGTVGYVSFQIEFNTGRVFLWGVLGMVLIAPVAFILAVSIVGIVLIPVELILVAAAFLLGSISVAQLIGKKITVAVKRPGRTILVETLLGTIVLWLIGLIPVFGWIVKILVLLFGFGGVIQGILSHRRAL
ncbi:MAG: hypothetical protein ACP5G0_01120 [Desulfomonilia bacterium]